MRPRVLPGLLALLLALTGSASAQMEPEMDRQTENIDFVAHRQYPQGTDMFFQRREGRQKVDGRTMMATRDYLFGGADASGAVGDPPEGTPQGLRIFDVTAPTDPVELAAIECPGYHADVAAYDDYLLQGIDSASTNEGCAPEFDPRGVDKKGVAGVRIFDITDPARPTVVAFLDSDHLGTTVHNMSMAPWSGMLYIAGSSFTSANPVLSIVDLTAPGFPATVIPMRDISPTATAECHDIGLAEMDHRDFAFCAAVTETFVWDISQPLEPKHVSVVLGAAETIHHGARLAPDGETLVLNDELGGAAAAPGCLPTENDPIGGLWFYDISVPELPVLLGTFSTSELAAKSPCTSHFYNFVPDAPLLTIGWYKSGVIVVDYSNRTQPREHAAFTPTGGDFWAGYVWHGYVYGSSFGGGGLYGGTNEAGGLWVLRLDGVGDVEPSHYDMGLTWAPWDDEMPRRDDRHDQPQEDGPRSKERGSRH